MLTSLTYYIQTGKNPCMSAYRGFFCDENGQSRTGGCLYGSVAEIEIYVREMRLDLCAMKRVFLYLERRL